MKRSVISCQLSVVSLRRSRQSAVGNRQFSSFTLIELLAVIGIIVLLAGMIIGTATYANRKALQSKTQSQLHQFTLALELFKVDNGYYPITTNDAPRTNTISHVIDSGTTNNMWCLYNQLLGYSITNAPPMLPNLGKNYFPEIKADQIQATSGTNYLVDPYGNYWGYFCTTNSSAGWTANQYNSRSYDLWSYGLSITDPTNSLIANWRKQ